VNKFLTREIIAFACHAAACAPPPVGKGGSSSGRNANKDGSKQLRSPFKTTGNKAADAIKLTRLDRGSSERKAAAKMFEEAYGKKKAPSAPGRKVNANKDGSKALRGEYKTTGNRAQDLIKLTRLDRGSAERKAAAKAFETAYGKK
jgi:hypothetical protein